MGAAQFVRAAWGGGLAAGPLANPLFLGMALGISPRGGGGARVGRGTRCAQPHPLSTRLYPPAPALPTRRPTRHRPGPRPPLPTPRSFDPLRLADSPSALAWYQQAELQNGRWAMLGAAGILGENLLGNLGIAGPAAKTPWYEAGAYTYFAPPQTLFIVQLFLFAWVEARRYQDFVKPGSVNDDPIFKGNSLPAGEQWGRKWRVWRDVLFTVWRPGRRATHPTRLQPPTRQRPRLPGRHL